MKTLNFFNEDEPDQLLASFTPRGDEIDVSARVLLDRKDVNKLMTFLDDWLESA